MKKLLIVGLILCWSGIAQADFSPSSPADITGGTGVLWSTVRGNINDNFDVLWAIDFSDIAAGTTVKAFVVDTGGSITYTGSGEIHASDFTLLAAAEGGEFDILNLGIVAADTFKADAAAVSIGDPAPGNTGDDVHIMMDGAPDAEDSYSGLTIIDKNAGESTTQWDLVYFDTTDSEWKQADADAVGEWPAWGMGVAAGSDTTELIVLTKGIVRNDDWDWTIGAVLYLDDTTPGGLTETAPSTTDDCVQPVAIAITADVIMLDVNPIHGYGKVE